MTGMLKVFCEIIENVLLDHCKESLFEISVVNSEKLLVTYHIICPSWSVLMPYPEKHKNSFQNCTMKSKKFVSKSFEHLSRGESLSFLQWWIGDSSRLRFWDLMKLMFFFHCVFSLVCRYSEEQYVDLKKWAQTDNPETIHFLKTLKTCKELRWVVSVFLWQMLIQFLWAL